MAFPVRTQDILTILFRKSGKGSFYTDNCEPSSFLLDFLDILCHENILEHEKIQVLTVLQEHMEWSDLDLTSVEHVIGSLNNMYCYPMGNDYSAFYKSQLLVTVTTVLVLSSAKLENLQKDSETLQSSIQMLNDIITQVNDPSSTLLRKTACECILEIEISYPGLLQDRVGHFFDLFNLERSVVFQQYMILCVTTLKNTLVHLSTFSDKFSDKNHLNDILLNQLDLSLKLQVLPENNVIEEYFPVGLNIGNSNCIDISLPEKFDRRELKRVVSCIVENSHLLTNLPLFHVLIQLVHCVKLASLSPSVFKSQFLNNLSTISDLPLFQLLLLLMSTFGSDVFEENDYIILLHRLCNLSNQPHLQIGERLLCYKWLIHFPHPNQTTLSELIDFTQKANFHPTTFDHLEIVPGKLDVLSSCYKPGNSPDIATATLMNCLICLHKPIKNGVKRPYATLLFRVLFTYYSRHQNTALVQEIYRFLLSFVTEHPDLVSHILDFTSAVSILTPDSFLPCEILRNFTDYIIALPLKKQLKNIRNYLKAFEFAMKLKDIPPTGTLQYLIELLKSNKMASGGGWFVGNSVLQICRNILQYHNTTKLITDFGECLLTIADVYTDVDICDRAMFYYSLLTSISADKCSQLLSGSLSENNSKTQHHQQHSNLPTTTFATDLPMKHKEKQFLSLTRVPEEISSREISLNDKEEQGCEDITTNDHASTSFDETNQSFITIPFYLHYNTEPCEAVPDRIFAVVLQFHTSSNYDEISDIHVPYLSYNNCYKPSEGCQVIKIKFSPKEPVPASINVRAIYTDSNGCSFIVSLNPIIIGFSDLFIPLSGSTKFIENTPEMLSSRQTFEALWKYIEEHQYSRKNQNFKCAKSVMSLKNENNKLKDILSQVCGYIIEENDSETLVGVVLPPKYHLLLQFKHYSSCDIVVNIATNYWKILGLVGEFLGKT